MTAHNYSSIQREMRQLTGRPAIHTLSFGWVADCEPHTLIDNTIAEVCTLVDWLNDHYPDGYEPEQADRFED